MLRLLYTHIVRTVQSTLMYWVGSRRVSSKPTARLWIHIAVNEEISGESTYIGLPNLKRKGTVTFQ